MKTLFTSEKSYQGGFKEASPARTQTQTVGGTVNMDVCVSVCLCLCVRVCACCSLTPKVELKELAFCFHKHPVKHLTLLLIEALDLQFSYANYFNNLKKQFQPVLSLSDASQE